MIGNLEFEVRYCWPLILILTGCGGQTVATVSGDVLVDDKPIEKGVIEFAPLDNAGDVAKTEIINGHYDVTTTPGKKKVMISAQVVVRQHQPHPSAPVTPVTEEMLPPRYNSASELEMDVKPGSNSKKWELEGKKKS